MGKVELRRISKRFGSVVALQPLDLDVRDGEFFTILGPSGCGKSTILNLIAGLEEPTTGDIIIDGSRVNDLPPQQRDVAMVFQSYALYPHKSVYENIAFPLRVRRVPDAEVSERVQGVAASLHLTDLLRRSPRQLSGGQRQRVALARAIVRQPRLYLMDEPLANLDAQLRASTRAELKRLHRDLRTTTIYVTHDQLEAMALSDRMAVLRDGVAQQVGTPHKLYHAPANRFVATFLGSPPMNELDVIVGVSGAFLVGTKRRPLTLARDDERGAPTPMPLSTPGKPGRKLVLGIRPQHVRVAAGESETGELAQVVYVEALGADTYVTADLAGAAITGLAEPSFQPLPGDACRITMPRSKAHFFATEGGERLP